MFDSSLKYYLGFLCKICLKNRVFFLNSEDIFFFERHLLRYSFIRVLRGFMSLWPSWRWRLEFYFQFNFLNKRSRSLFLASEDSCNSLRIDFLRRQKAFIALCTEERKQSFKEKKRRRKFGFNKVCKALSTYAEQRTSTYEKQNLLSYSL